MRSIKSMARQRALRTWRASFSEWLRHRTDETLIAEHAARQHYLLLAS